MSQKDVLIHRACRRKLSQETQRRPLESLPGCRASAPERAAAGIAIGWSFESLIIRYVPGQAAYGLRRWLARRRRRDSQMLARGTLTGG